MTSADASERDVLFVVMDTVRKDHLSVYDYDRPTTPGLEAFAEDAAVFEQAVAPAPWTLPVHASLFTGLYPSEHNANQENPYLEGATTLAESLSGTHESACYSSNAWITPYTHLTDGFGDQDNFFQVMPGEFMSGPLAKAWKTMNDNEQLRKVADWLVSVGNTFHEYFASGGGSDSKTPQVIDRTREFVDGVDDDENFFAFVNLMDAHLPYHPPEEYREEFAPDVDSTAVCQNSKEYNSGARDIDDAEFDDIRGLYDAEIRHIDAELRRLFDWLQAEGRWEDTLVVVCADHGELHGEHDLYGHEFSIYDPLVNVPLLVKHPDLDAGRYDQQVELIDLYHTVLDHAGVDPAGETAVSLDERRSLLGDDYREFDDGEFAFVEYSRPVVELKQLEQKASAAGITLDEDSRFYSRMRAGRRPDAKYIRNERIPDEAYRLDKDPGETENRAGTSGEIDDSITEVEAALSRFEDQVGGPWEGDAAGTGEDVLDDMSEDAKDRLQDLGYID
ncbi:sulfatase-like hydrolase/transferase [Halostella pelagica]|uniref:sulfatase-like hydrolase/transferase n=1 Tax=Halostella pelagica TaxID=2583824 RepID=UPI001080BA37|nr:sulfatase-like hydrolase/transferase [Halostella pelagica]